MARQNKNLTTCSFCGKDHSEVVKLIAGPGVFICDSCINVCKSILDKELGISSIPVQDIKERIALLRELRDKKDITEKDYQARTKKLVEQI